MRKWLLRAGAFAVGALLHAAIYAADIDFPELPHAEPAPAPMPAPDAPTPLLAGKWYVIGNDSPLLILPNASGKVTVSARKGPLVLPTDIVVGRKADKNDPDFVTIPGPYVYAVKAAPGATGTVTLQIIPALNALDKDSKQIPLAKGDIKTRVLVVNGEPDPIPDPNPKPPVPPNPPTPTVSHLYFGIVKDPRNLTVAQATLIGDTLFWDSLKTRGHEWDAWNNDSPRAKELGYVQAATSSGIPLPVIVVMDKDKGGKPLDVIALPADKTGVSALEAKYTGKK